MSERGPLLLVAILRPDRKAVGALSLVRVEGSIVAGPWPALGKADNETAAAHRNPSRDPLLPFGDHPEGRYRITRAVDTEGGNEGSLRKYGPVRLVLVPISGDCSKAAANKRSGLLVHGGALSEAGMLRPTYGCLRTTNAAVVALAAWVRSGLLADYVCAVVQG